MTPGGRPHAAARPPSPSAAAADSRGGTDPDEPAMELARFVSAACCGGELDEALAALAGDADACAPLSLPMSSLPLQLARLVLLCPLEAEERLRHVLWRVGALPSPVSQLIIRPTHVRSARAAAASCRAASRLSSTSERLTAAPPQVPLQLLSVAGVSRAAIALGGGGTLVSFLGVTSDLGATERRVHSLTVRCPSCDAVGVPIMVAPVRASQRLPCCGHELPASEAARLEEDLAGRSFACHQAAWLRDACSAAGGLPGGGHGVAPPALAVELAGELCGAFGLGQAVHVIGCASVDVSAAPSSAPDGRLAAGVTVHALSARCVSPAALWRLHGSAVRCAPPTGLEALGELLASACPEAAALPLEARAALLLSAAAAAAAGGGAQQLHILLLEEGGGGCPAHARALVAAASALAPCSALLASAHSDPPLQPRAGPGGAVGGSTLSFLAGGGVLVALLDVLPPRLRRDLAAAMASPWLQPTGGAAAVGCPRLANGAAVWALASAPQLRAAAPHARPAAAFEAATAAFDLAIQLPRRSFADEILGCSAPDAGCEEAAAAALRAPALATLRAAVAAAAAAPPPALDGACRALLGAYAAAARASGAAASSLSECLQTLAALACASARLGGRAAAAACPDAALAISLFDSRPDGGALSLPSLDDAAAAAGGGDAALEGLHAALQAALRKRCGGGHGAPGDGRDDDDVGGGCSGLRLLEP